MSDEIPEAAMVAARKFVKGVTYTTEDWARAMHAYAVSYAAEAVSALERQWMADLARAYAGTNSTPMEVVMESVAIINKRVIDLAVAESVRAELQGVIDFASGYSRAQAVEDYAVERLNTIMTRAERKEG